YDLSVAHTDAFGSTDGGVDATSIDLDHSGTLRAVYVDNSGWRGAGLYPFLIGSAIAVALGVLIANINDDGWVIASAIGANAAFLGGVVTGLAFFGKEDGVLWRFG